LLVDVAGGREQTLAPGEQFLLLPTCPACTSRLHSVSKPFGCFSRLAAVIWNERAALWLKVGLAALGLLVFAWEERRRGSATTGEAHDAVPRSALVPTSLRPWQLLGGLGLLVYVNFGAFHFQGVFVHLWDITHHALGAKYFDELGYDGLYECLAVADLESEPGGADRLEARQMIDLRTNQMATTTTILAHPARCRNRFSPLRWRAFVADVDFFRQRFPPADWERLSGDHGFNASPAWVLSAHVLVGDDPITWNRLRALASVDLVLMGGAFALVLSAFGSGPTAIAAIVFGTYFPSRLWWTGGSLLRWDWLAALLSGVALCRRGRNLAGGACWGYAALVRVFPVFALAGVALALVATWVRGRASERALLRALLRVLVGAGLMAVLLVPTSAVVRRPAAWRDFVANLKKHSSVPSPNRMGLATVLSFGRDHTSATLEQRSATETEARPLRGQWEAAQAATLKRRWIIWVALAAIGLVVVAVAVTEQPPWVAGLLGLLLCPLGPPLACYYYAFVAALPLLADRRREVGGMTLALALASLVLAKLSRRGFDEQYMAQSALVLVAFAFIATSFLGGHRGPSSPPRAGDSDVGAGTKSGLARARPLAPQEEGIKDRATADGDPQPRPGPLD
jgi:hypothetical protein